MTGWGQHLDDLAAATAGLLQADVVRTVPLTDTRGTLASRDALVAQLRELVGAVTDVPKVAVARPMTVFDITQRPGQALHQALSELPRSTDFGNTETDFYFTKNLPPYEQLWRDVARACVGLEGFVDGVAKLGEEHAWGVLRDVTDLAAALPALDHGLSEAILPWLKGGEDLGVPYLMLTHPAHDAVRVCTTEIRARVPADPPSSARKVPQPTVMGAGDLDKAMGRYVRTVLDRARELSIGDMRAVTRLLQFGGLDAAVVLQRAGQAVPGAESAAHGLRTVAELSAELREAPAKTLGPERLAVLRDSGDLQRQVRALAVHERNLPGAASDADLRRLAAPALEFAKHVENLTRALEIGVREALADGLMLIPSAADKTNQTALLWVPYGRGSGPGSVDEAPVVQQRASALAKAGESVAGGVWTAQADIGCHQPPAVDRTSTAAATARAQAGAARAQLRAALGQQLRDRPAPLASPLPAHPRLAPDGPVSGRTR